MTDDTPPSGQPAQPYPGPPPGWTSPSPPPAPVRSGIGSPLVAALIGVVIGALVVGGVWLAVGTLGGPAVGTSAFTLPAKIDSYARFGDVKINQSEAGKQNVERFRAANEQNVQRLSKAYGGAAAVSEHYSDDQYKEQFHLVAVRATAPSPPFVPFVDAKVLHTVKPRDELLTFGEVNCVVVNELIPEGKPMRPDATHVINCLRTGPGLSVEIRSPGGDLAKNPEKVAALVVEAWTKLGG